MKQKQENDKKIQIYPCILMDGFLISHDWFSKFPITKFDKLESVTPNNFLTILQC